MRRMAALSAASGMRSFSVCSLSLIHILGCIRTVLATGGIAGMIVPHCKRDVTLVPNLLLDGLYHVWKCNR